MKVRDIVVEELDHIHYPGSTINSNGIRSYEIKMRIGKACSTFDNLRTFARKSSHIEISFISRLKLGHKLLIPKVKKNSTSLFRRQRQGKNAPISIDRSS